MPTYSEDTLLTALTAYRNGEYTSIRKCAYVRKHQSRDGNHSLPARDPHAERMRIPRDPQTWHIVPQEALFCSCSYLDSLGNR